MRENPTTFTHEDNRALPSSTGARHTEWQPLISPNLGAASQTKISQFDMEKYVPATELTVEEHNFCDTCTSMVTRFRLAQRGSDGSLPPLRGVDFEKLKSKCRAARISFWHIFTNYRPVEAEFFLHYPDIASLQESAHLRCHLCSLLLSITPTGQSGQYGIVLSRWKYLGSELKITLITNPQKRRLLSIPMLFKQIFPQIDINTARKYSTLDEWLDIRVPEPEEKIYPLPATLRFASTASTASFALARKWLRNCKRNHLSCISAPLSKTVFPKRLLELAIKEGQLSLRLRAAESLASDIEYVALSHCWGSQKPFMLLQSNLISLNDDIPVADLAKSFLDAAIITLKMGYSYLWIDSLCIIQDNNEDWRHEASIMGRIYRHCVFSIAALSGQCSEAGCFRERNPLSKQGCWLPGSTHYVDHPVIGTIQRHDSGFYVEHLARKGSLPPLMQRAWVVQELALAPRTLYYGETMVSWECHHSTAAEAHTHGLSMRQKSVKSLFRTLTELSESSPANQWWQNWWKLLKIYTSTKTSFEEDRWIAILGLVNFIREERGLTTVAGLWKEYLISDLLWNCKVPTRRLKFGYPTWSWISVDAKVTQKAGMVGSDGRWAIMAAVSVLKPSIFSTAKFEDGIQMSNAGQIPQSATYGATAMHRYLYVEGPIIPFSWKVEVDKYGKSTWYMYGLNNESRGAWWYPDVLPDSSLKTWALFIAHGQSPSSDDPDLDGFLQQALGLVLCPIDIGRGIWSRLGSFQMARMKPVEEKAVFEDLVTSKVSRRGILLV